jgi:nitrite reductase/ring-hydroxylating ferredoxin subunit
LALAWDTGSPYHYVRTAPRGEKDVFLIVGGEDHRTGSGDESAERYARLERWARERFPSLGAIEHCWSGQVFEPAGGLGFAGPAGDKVKELYATGHSGNGITHGTLSAILLSSLLSEGAHDWTSVFDPSRVKLDDAIEVAKQGAATVAGLGERLKGEELESSDQVRPGEAAIVGKGSSRLAVYREPDGKLWECSALCSHMGCVVHWNSAERSWDCPCHGSRFDVSGHVLEGPAMKDLTPADRAHAR